MERGRVEGVGGGGGEKGREGGILKTVDIQLDYTMYMPVGADVIVWDNSISSCCIIMCLGNILQSVMMLAHVSIVLYYVCTCCDY